jgi:hypothetical protein
LTSLSEWFSSLVGKWRSDSVQPSIFPALRDKPLPEAVKQASERSPSQPTLVPGNYYFFNFFIELTIDGTTYLGYPKRALRDVGQTPPVTAWGAPVELAWPNPAVPRMPLVLDPEKGLTGRTITSPEDLLGVEGTLGDDKRYCFEKILDVGRNQVVYSLFCEQNRTRIAYGFSLELFKAAGL